MRKFGRILLAVMVVTAVAGVALVALRQPTTDPTYKGKRLSIWLKEYDPEKSPSERSEADKAVSHIGTNAIPMLLGMLRVEDSSLKMKLLGLAWRLRIKVRYHSAWDCSLEAGEAFRQLGARASSAVPDLIKIYNPNNLPAAAAIMNALGHIGPSAGSAVPLVLRVATNTTNNSALRINAYWTLGEIHSEPELVVPVLRNCLHDSNVMVRRNALLGLGNFGTNAREATSDIVGLLRDGDRDTRAFALISTGQIWPECQRLARSSNWDTEHSDPTLAVVIKGFGALGTNAAPAVPALVDFLADGDERVRFSASNALRAIEPETATKAGVK
jgi:HEAT repeat protein